MADGRAALAAAWLLVLALAGLWAVDNVEVHGDLTLFMPRAVSDTDRLLLAELSEGPVSRVVLIGLEGEPEPRLAEASNALADRLRRSALFSRVANGNERLAGEERETLFARRYLLSPRVGAETFTAESLRTALERRLRELTSALPVADKVLLARDPTGEFRAMVQSWRGEHEPGRRHGVWFATGASRALLLAQTRAPGFDPEAQARALTAIRDAVREVAPAVTLSVTGPGVFAVQARDRIRAEARDLSIAASALAMLVLLLGYRSWLLLALGALPLATGVIFASIVVAALFDGIHGIALAFGVTVLGVAIDYPIHVFSHLSAEEPVARSLARIWPTLRLSAVTTAMGYLAMTGAEFPGLIQLALFAIVGLLSAAAATRWGVPALLPPQWRPRHRPRISAWHARHAPPGRAWLALPLAAALICAIYLLQRGAGIWQDDLTALSPVSPQALAHDRAMRAELAVPEVNHLAAIRAPDAQGALERSEALAAGLAELVAAGVVQGFDLAARYVPSVETQLARRAALPERAALEAALAAAMRDLPFRAGAFHDFVDDVVRAREQAPVVPGDLAGSAPALRAEPLLFQVDDGWVALVTFTGVEQPEVLARWLDERSVEGVVYLDTRASTEALLGAFRDQGLARIAWGGLLIALTLAIGLGSLRRVPSALLPGLVAIVIDMALLVLSGNRLTLFHLVALLLVLGISIDYALFFGREEGGTAQRQRTLHGLLVCVLSTSAVFALLSLSDLPVLHAIGRTVALGVVLGFAAAALISQRPAPARGAGA